MSKADEFRARADHAAELAKKARDVEAKRDLEEVARQWRDMAAQAERYGW